MIWCLMFIPWFTLIWPFKELLPVNLWSNCIMMILPCYNCYNVYNLRYVQCCMMWSTSMVKTKWELPQKIRFVKKNVPSDLKLFNQSIKKTHTWVICIPTSWNGTIHVNKYTPHQCQNLIFYDLAGFLHTMLSLVRYMEILQESGLKNGG